MQIVHERCAGLDVHKRTVVVCVLTPGAKEVRTFGTVTRQLREMVDWLVELRVSHVAMESTGIYWQLVFNLLEGHGIRNPLRIRTTNLVRAGAAHQPMSHRRAPNQMVARLVAGCGVKWPRIVDAHCGAYSRVRSCTGRSRASADLVTWPQDGTLDLSRLCGPWRG